MKVGGGGTERFMVTVPILVAFLLSMYALGGPSHAFHLLERFAVDAWIALGNMMR